jgi:hypothetical protein
MNILIKADLLSLEITPLAFETYYMNQFHITL